MINGGLAGLVVGINHGLSSRRPTHFVLAVARDDLGFLLIELGEFRTRGMIDPRQFVELGMQRQIVAPVGALDEQCHREYRERADRVPVEGGPVEDQPQEGVNQNDKKGGGMSRRLPDMGRPVASWATSDAAGYFTLTFGSRLQTRNLPSAADKAGNVFGGRQSEYSPRRDRLAMPAFSNSGWAAST